MGRLKEEAWQILSPVKVDETSAGGGCKGVQMMLFIRNGTT
jgi:hypothetical protein